METQELNADDLSDMDLVNIVNQTEGFAWRLNHDAADGRIPDDSIDSSIAKLKKSRDQAVEEIKKRTGYSTHERLTEHIQGKLKEQD